VYRVLDVIVKNPNAGLMRMIHILNGRLTEVREVIEMKYILMDAIIAILNNK
jgi:hypothetical protein